MNKPKDSMTFEELFNLDANRADVATNQSEQRPYPVGDYSIDTEDLEKHMTVARVDETYFNTGIGHAEQKKLKTGKISIKLQCDLHGYTRREALVEVVRFVQRVQANQNRYALIIFGKGNLSKDNRPVVKPTVLSYLKDCPQVLAYAMAHPRDGGTGAAYIIVKKLR